MKKKTVVFAALLVAAACIVWVVQRRTDDREVWEHRTFQGTVTGMWTEPEETVFSVALASGTEKKFRKDASTIYAVDFQVGDSVVVESDYDRKQHNGVDVPYPAIVIADPSVTD